MANALPRGRRQRLASGKSCEPVRRKGLGVDVHVTTGAKRAGLALIVKAAGAAALVVAFTATIFAQSGSDFLNNVDPLFSGVLTTGNLDNTRHQCWPKRNAAQQSQRLSHHSKRHRYEEYDHRLYGEHSQLVPAAGAAISDP